MIRHGRPFLIFPGVTSSVLALARNMAPMSNIACSFPRKYKKMVCNTGGGEMLLFRALARNIAPMTYHADNTLRFFE